MSDSRSQRWRDRRTTFVANDRIMDPAIHSVDIIHCQRAAKPFIEQHHYSGSFPATRLSCGLFRNSDEGSQMVGVVSFSVPINSNSGPKHTGLEPPSTIELGRLVLLDHVEANAESWFVSRAFKLLRSEKPDIEAVFSYSDPVQRRDEFGRIVLPGHVGSVYQALSASCRGRGTPRTLLTLPNGRVMSERALSKLRKGDQGAEYAERQLLNAGARPMRHGESPQEWIASLRTSGFLSTRRHPGNWVYAFALTHKARKAAQSLPCVDYPKKDPAVRSGDVSTLDLMLSLAA